MPFEALSRGPGKWFFLFIVQLWSHQQSQGIIGFLFFGWFVPWKLDTKSDTHLRTTSFNHDNILSQHKEMFKRDGSSSADRNNQYLTIFQVNLPFVFLTQDHYRVFFNAPIFSLPGTKVKLSTLVHQFSHFGTHIKSIYSKIYNSQLKLFREQLPINCPHFALLSSELPTQASLQCTFWANWATGHTYDWGYVFAQAREKERKQNNSQKWVTGALK